MNCKKGGCDVMERDAAGPCLARMLSARVGHWRHCLLFACDSSGHTNPKCVRSVNVFATWRSCTSQKRILP